MADPIDFGSFDLGSELSEAEFYLSKKMFDEAREVLERAHHFMPYHKKVREALDNFTRVTGQPIGAAPSDGEDDEDDDQDEAPAAPAPAIARAAAPKPAAAAPAPAPVKPAPAPVKAAPAPAPQAAVAPAPSCESTGDGLSGDVDVEEEYYDAQFYVEQEMYKEALLCVKKIMKVDQKHAGALKLVTEIRQKLKK